jgi:hypothetical protein
MPSTVVTQSVTGCIPTRSVGTIKLAALTAKGWRFYTFIGGGGGGYSGSHGRRMPTKLIVPTLRVGMPLGTLRVPASPLTQCRAPL